MPVRFTPLLLALTILSACVSDSRPKHTIAPPPPNLQPTDLLPFVSFMEDSDNNGYRDTAVLTLLVFARNYAEASVYVPGSLELRLAGKGGKTIRTWSLPADTVAGLAKKMPAGPALYLRVSLLDDPAGDHFDETLTDLHIVFTPTAGTPVKATATGITIGRVGR